MNFITTNPLFKYVFKSILFVFVFANISCNKSIEDSEDLNFFENKIETGQLPYISVKSDEMIQNEPKVPGDIYIKENDSITHSSPIGVEYRGSTSFRLTDKKSYGFEIWDENNEDSEMEILNFPEEEDWILMGHVFRSSDQRVFDPSLMHHYIGYELSRSIGMYASRSKFVELEVNGDYKGVYILMEKLKRDKNRIDIKKLKEEDITGGYILKIDKTAGGDVIEGSQPLSYFENNWDDDAKYSESISFRSDYDINGVQISFPPFNPPYHPAQYLETYFLYEYPKSDDITDQQKQYIQNYISDFENSLFNIDNNVSERDYNNYIDIDSFVDYFILNELTGNIDAYRLSTYMHKNRGGKLKMGPIWDLNIGYNRQDRVPFTDWIANYNQYVPRDAWMVPFWWEVFLGDNYFKQRLKERWTQYRSNQFSNQTILNLVQETADYLIENGSIDRNYQRWIGISIDYLQVIDALKSHLHDRLLWMDQKINSM